MQVAVSTVAPDPSPAPVRVLAFPRPAAAPGIGVRPATDADLPAVRSLVRAEPHMSRSGIDNASRFTVAVDTSDAVIGAVQLKPAGAHATELATMVVSPDQRGRNVAKLLMWEALQRFAPSGVVDGAQGALLLRTRPAEAPFYERFGFSELGIGDVPKTPTMLLTALAGSLGAPARVMGLPADLRIDLRPPSSDR